MQRRKFFAGVLGLGSAAVPTVAKKTPKAYGVPTPICAKCGCTMELVDYYAPPVKGKGTVRCYGPYTGPNKHTLIEFEIELQELKSADL